MSWGNNNTKLFQSMDLTTKIFTVATVKPEKPKFNIMSNPNLKKNEQDFKKTWIGIDCNITGYPTKESICKNISSCFFGNEYYDDLLSAIKFIENNTNSKQSKISGDLIDYIQFKKIDINTLLKVNTEISKKEILFHNPIYSYKILKCDSNIIKIILEQNRFSKSENHDWNIYWAGKNIKDHEFENLRDFQKINHFPKAEELCHKDKLASNIKKMKANFNSNEFDIIPETFILPREVTSLISSMNKNPNQFWIMKPFSQSQGIGIFLIQKRTEIPHNEEYVACSYIMNPLLINDLKFDLRIYVLLTSVEPLRIYVYNDGLCRFSCEPYSKNIDPKNLYANLTNYSLNKKNPNFIQNFSIEHDDFGHKWSLSALFKHLEENGVDIKLLWSRIYDLIIKSIISVEPFIADTVIKMNLKSHCFQVFGYDVLIDENLKPWLIEVNMAPSLNYDSPIDAHIKSNLIVDTLNLICLKKYNFRFSLSPESPKSNNRKINLNDKLINEFKTVNFRLRQIISDSVEEGQRSKNYILIFPCKGSNIYEKYLQRGRHIHKFIQKNLINPDLPRLYILPEQHHKKSVNEEETFPSKIQSPLQQIPKVHSETKLNLVKVHPKFIPKIEKKKITLKGIKFLVSLEESIIEYVKRLRRLLENVDFLSLDKIHLNSIENFINHKFWQIKLEGNFSKISIQQRLKQRGKQLKEKFFADNIELNLNSERRKEHKQYLKKLTLAFIEDKIYKSMSQKKYPFVQTLFLVNENIGIVSHIYKSKRLVHKKTLIEQKSGTSYKIFPTMLKKSVVDINFHTTKNFNSRAEPVLMKKFSDINLMSKKYQFITRKIPNNFLQENRKYKQINFSKKFEPNQISTSPQKFARNKFHSTSNKILRISPNSQQYEYQDKSKANRKIIPFF